MTSLFAVISMILFILCFKEHTKNKKMENDPELFMDQYSTK